MTFKELASILEIDDLETPCEYDLSDVGIKIETPTGFEDVSNFVVKKKVDTCFLLGNLRGTGEHRVLVNNEWVKLRENNSATLLNSPMNVVDISVPNGNCYIANNLINHNTTPGGKAIPFHSSVRIKLGAGQKIENKNKEIIGINVSAKTIKNKVASPFKTVEFQIHFGVGIKEHEQIFDRFRKAGKLTLGNEVISVEGTGAWKKFVVLDNKTKKCLIEKKFYKADFDKILDDPLYEKYINALIKHTFISTIENSSIDIESYEEVRSAAIELQQNLVDPE